MATSDTVRFSLLFLVDFFSNQSYLNQNSIIINAFKILQHIFFNLLLI